MRNTFIDNQNAWLRMSDIDYVGRFVKAWLARVVSERTAQDYHPPGQYASTHRPVTLTGMKHMTILVGFSLAYLLFPLTASATQFRFDPGCPLPYEAIKQAQPIDDACTAAGESEDYAPSSQAQRRANEAKNQLCAPGPPVLLTFRDFEQLQGRVEDEGIPFGPFKHPKDRAALRNVYPTSVNEEAVTVGEGSVVRLVAYVAEARTSNVSSGESVNCKRKGKANNDIHVTLVRQPDDPLCVGIVAEVIPHFRPTAWQDTTIAAITRPVRVTGHLFFDSPHLPCDEEGRAVGGNPARVSLWEIHPVYSFEICKHTTLAGCRGDHDEDWTLLGAPEP